MNYDHVLFLGFGGPRKREEVRPFLQKVAQGRNIPETRLKEVEHHYEQIGGFSPYHEECVRFVNAFEANLNEQISMPIFLGMKNWHPFLSETLNTIKGGGFRKGLVCILAPHRSEASFDRYLEGLKWVQAEDIQYEPMEPWFDHPLLIQAHAKAIHDAAKFCSPTFPPLQGNRDGVGARPFVLFTAHSIPEKMKDSELYQSEFQKTSALIAEQLACEWGMAYQSRSGSPKEPWLGPAVEEWIPKLVVKGVQEILVVPIGFLCDNAEILYDLDIEFQDKLKVSGIHYRRSATVMRSPEFLSMWKELILDRIRTPMKESI